MYHLKRKMNENPGIREESILICLKRSKCEVFLHLLYCTVNFLINYNNFLSTLNILSGIQFTTKVFEMYWIRFVLQKMSSSFSAIFIEIRSRIQNWAKTYIHLIFKSNFFVCRFCEFSVPNCSAVQKDRKTGGHS